MGAESLQVRWAEKNGRLCQKGNGLVEVWHFGFDEKKAARYFQTLSGNSFYASKLPWLSKKQNEDASKLLFPLEHTK